MADGFAGAAGEKLALAGRFLRVSFGALAGNVRGELHDAFGRVAAVVPAVTLLGTSTCAFDLTRLAPGFGYAVFLVVDGRPRRVAAPSFAGASIVASLFAAGDAERHAELRVEVGTRALVLSIADKAPAVEAASAASPEVRFSIVAPVYNVGRYLDDFFASLCTQTIGFAAHMEVIAVDDGSTDESPEVLARWRDRFPDNIRVVRKENGGLSSARNAGLPLARGAWIVFLDPDDFVNPDYFRAIDAAVREAGETEIALVACNMIRFMEATGATSDRHPLRFRFAHGHRRVAVRDLGEDVHTSASSVVFNRALLARHELAFDERLTRGFEDGHFIGRFLLRVPESSVLFVPDAIYLYRQRADRTSITDGLMESRDFYLARLRHGHLALLREAADRGPVPRHIQMLVLYSLTWLFRRVISEGDRVAALLGADGRREHLEVLAGIFAFIDADVIAGYRLATMPFLMPVGLLGMFRGVDPPFQVVAVEALDRSAGRMGIRSWSRRPGVRLAFTLDGNPVVPVSSAESPRLYLGEPFAFERATVLPLPTGAPGEGVLRAFCDGEPALLAVGRTRRAAASLAALRTDLAAL